MRNSRGDPDAGFLACDPFSLCLNGARGLLSLLEWCQTRRPVAMLLCLFSPLDHPSQNSNLDRSLFSFETPCLRLQRLSGKTYDEIADEMGLTNTYVAQVQR